MKILATLDGTEFSESIIPQLIKLAALPGVQFALLCVAHDPHATLRSPGAPVAFGVPNSVSDNVGVARTAPHLAEDHTQAIDRRLSELKDYLSDVASRLPAGSTCAMLARVSNDVPRTVALCRRRRT